MKRTSRKHNFNNRNIDKLKNTLLIHTRTPKLPAETPRSIKEHGGRKFRRLARPKTFGYQTDKRICNEQKLSAKAQKES